MNIFIYPGCVMLTTGKLSEIARISTINREITWKRKRVSQADQKQIEDMAKNWNTYGTTDKALVLPPVGKLVGYYDVAGLRNYITAEKVYGKTVYATGHVCFGERVPASASPASDEMIADWESKGRPYNETIN